jgi:hypothetical protein
MSKTSVSLDSKKEEAPGTAQAPAKKMSLKSLKDLIYLGRIERTVSCGDFTFVLKSITAEDQKNMVAKVMKMPEDIRLLNAKIVSLAFSVEKVNGVLIEDLSEDDDSVDLFDKKINVIKNLQLSVVNKLFKNYEEILEESNSQIEIEEVKK